MALIIEQKPRSAVMPVGQQVMFTVSDNTTVATKFKVKFVAQLFVDIVPITLTNSAQVVSTYKTTPNNKGVGMFDFMSVLETFLSSDNEPTTEISGALGNLPIATSPSYKGTAAQSEMFPLHIVDKFSMNQSSIRYYALNFYIEYSDTATGSVIDFTTLPPTATEQYIIFNGVLQYDDVLTQRSNNYFYNIDRFLPDVRGGVGTKKFLSNAPTTQYARLTDYGTLPMLNVLPTTADYDEITSVAFNYLNAANVSIGADIVLNNDTNGGVQNNPGWKSLSSSKLLYIGAFPGNLRNWSSTFQGLTATVDSYTVSTTTVTGQSTELYTVKIICDNERGYEGIRLCWLNQWGVWDYYTFNKKSVRSIRTRRESYTQLEGTWNESTFRIADFKGGEKNFRVNTKERMRVNSDNVTEAEGLWFQELINSVEVYMIEGYQTDTANTITNKYVTPVTIKTSSFTTKTIANDKVMQYSIDFEYSRNRRTQSV